jgi:hypothetical protein
VGGSDGGEEPALRTVVDDECLVAGGHQVAGFLVGSVTDLSRVSAPIPCRLSFRSTTASLDLDPVVGVLQRER